MLSKFIRICRGHPCNVEGARVSWDGQEHCLTVLGQSPCPKFEGINAAFGDIQKRELQVQWANTIQSSPDTINISKLSNRRRPKTGWV